jgi:sialic acid synthase SpsE
MSTPAKIILDPGSSHEGKQIRAHKLIEEAAHAGADAIKFQLFKDIPPNIALPFEWFPELATHAKSLGIEIFASVWDMDAIEVLQNCGCNSVKFAYSQRNNDSLISYCIQNFDKVYVSMDYMETPLRDAVNLFCLPKYPVYSLLSFDCIFEKFNGFSDHTLGYHQTIRAVEAGALYIEKHFRLDDGDERLPDNKFALKPHKVKEMIDGICKMFDNRESRKYGAEIHCDTKVDEHTECGSRPERPVELREDKTYPCIDSNTDRESLQTDKRSNRSKDTIRTDRKTNRQRPIKNIGAGPISEEK